MKTRLMVPLVPLLLLPPTGCTSVKRFLYEGFGRDGWQKPDEVVRALNLQPGMRVADLGAGGGYFTFRLADAVGPQGRIYAADIDEGMIDYLQERARQEGRANVEAVLAEPDDARLLERVDLIFTCNTYHHIEERRAYFARAAGHLRSGGRIAIVEYERKGWFQKLFGHYTAPELIREEMSAAGYRLVESHDFLPRQSFQVFARDEPAQPAG